MRNPLHLYGSSVGKKVTMAASGVVLLGFVVLHMVGNLKVYQGPEKFDAYAEFLREIGSPALGHGQLLWAMRLVLLASVLVHVVAAVQLARSGLAARGVRYKKFDDLSLSYASRTMRWGGVILLAFVVYHLMHLTLGNAHPEFRPGEAYHNLVRGFRSWPVSLAYLIAMVPLALHIYHGVWSATQTLGFDNPRVLRWRRAVSVLLAGAVLAGNASIPLAVLTGIVD